MLLTVDIGNTNIVLGVFDGATLAHSWRLTTFRGRTADELGILVSQLFASRRLGPASVRGVVLASVVPPLTSTMAAMIRQYLGRETLIVESAEEIGMPVHYENPAEVGADRLVNGVAAYERYGRESACPVIVVDFGTATTFDAISGDGAYLGGVICPGVQISADALFQRAARLPRVEVRKPPALIGRTTVASMQSGLFYGYVAMVEGIVQRMRVELEGPQLGPARCVATGGLADVIAAETTLIEDVSPDLTLHGLRMVWDRSQAARPSAR